METTYKSAMCMVLVSFAVVTMALCLNGAKTCDAVNAGSLIALIMNGLLLVAVIVGAYLEPKIDTYPSKAVTK